MRTCLSNGHIKIAHMQRSIMSTSQQFDLIQLRSQMRAMVSKIETFNKTGVMEDNTRARSKYFTSMKQDSLDECETEYDAVIKKLCIEQAMEGLDEFRVKLRAFITKINCYNQCVESAKYDAAKKTHRAHYRGTATDSDSEPKVPKSLATLSLNTKQNDDIIEFSSIEPSYEHGMSHDSSVHKCTAQVPVAEKITASGPRNPKQESDSIVSSIGHSIPKWACGSQLLATSQPVSLQPASCGQSQAAFSSIQDFLKRIRSRFGLDSSTCTPQNSAKNSLNEISVENRALSPEFYASFDFDYPERSRFGLDSSTCTQQNSALNKIPVENRALSPEFYTSFDFDYPSEREEMGYSLLSIDDLYVDLTEDTNTEISASTNSELTRESSIEFTRESSIMLTSEGSFISGRRNWDTEVETCKSASLLMTHFVAKEHTNVNPTRIISLEIMSPSDARQDIALCSTMKSSSNAVVDSSSSAACESGQQKKHQTQSVHSRSQDLSISDGISTVGSSTRSQYLTLSDTTSNFSSRPQDQSISDIASISVHSSSKLHFQSVSTRPSTSTIASSTKSQDQSADSNSASSSSKSCFHQQQSVSDSTSITTSTKSHVQSISGFTSNSDSLSSKSCFCQQNVSDSS